MNNCSPNFNINIRMIRHVNRLVEAFWHANSIYVLSKLTFNFICVKLYPSEMGMWEKRKKKMENGKWKMNNIDDVVIHFKA